MRAGTNQFFRMSEPFQQHRAPPLTRAAAHRFTGSFRNSGVSPVTMEIVNEDTPDVVGQSALPWFPDVAGNAMTRELEELRLENARLRILLVLTEPESRAPARTSRPFLQL